MPEKAAPKSAVPRVIGILTVIAMLIGGIYYFWGRPKAPVAIAPVIVPPVVEPVNPTVIVPVQAMDLTVNFDFDQAVFNQSSIDATQVFWDDIKEGSGSISIQGYADSVGTEKYNLGLSLRRAQYVEALLREWGLDKQYTVITFGNGEDNPVADNDSSAGRAQNRRVEIAIAN